MLENLLADLIRALNANTEALNSLNNSPAAAPATSRPVPAFVNPTVTPVSVTPVAPAPASAVPAPVQAPAPAPVQAPAPAPAAPQAAPAAAPGLTLEQLRDFCATAGANGHTQDVIDFLHARGLKKIGELPPAAYQELVDYLKAKGAI